MEKREVPSSVKIQKGSPVNRTLLRVAAGGSLFSRSLGSERGHISAQAFADPGGHAHITSSHMGTDTECMQVSPKNTHTPLFTRAHPLMLTHTHQLAAARTLRRRACALHTPGAACAQTLAPKPKPMGAPLPEGKVPKTPKLRQKHACP